MNNIPNLSIKIKALRVLRSMSQTDLSSVACIRRELIIDYERGRAIPAQDQLQKIETALGITFNSATEAAFKTLAPELGRCNNGR